jgi:hypothetical protein
MRVVLAVCLLAGCVGPESYPPDDTGWGSGYGGQGGYSDYGCTSDSECGTGLVCARTHECLQAGEVHTVRTTWTLRGQPASQQTCAGAPNLAITFTTPSQDLFGFAPVPCRAGKFTVDKLPFRYSAVMLSREDEYDTGYPDGFDADGNASIDLPY